MTLKTQWLRTCQPRATTAGAQIAANKETSPRSRAKSTTNPNPNHTRSHKKKGGGGTPWEGNHTKEPLLLLSRFSQGILNKTHLSLSTQRSLSSLPRPCGHVSRTRCAKHASGLITDANTWMIGTQSSMHVGKFTQIQPMRAIPSLCPHVSV